MDDKEIIRELFPMNCWYNHKVEKNGKCYSSQCMMNTDDMLKKKIKKEGCSVFDAPCVQEYGKKQKNCNQRKPNLFDGFIRFLITKLSSLRR